MKFFLTPRLRRYEFCYECWSTTSSRLSSATTVQTRRFRFFGHMARLGNSQDMFITLNMSIRRLAKNWRRRSGRLCHTWLQTLEADFQQLYHGVATGGAYSWRSRTMESARVSVIFCNWPVHGLLGHIISSHSDFLGSRRRQIIIKFDPLSVGDLAGLLASGENNK